MTIDRIFRSGGIDFLQRTIMPDEDDKEKTRPSPRILAMKRITGNLDVIIAISPGEMFSNDGQVLKDNLPRGNLNLSDQAELFLRADRDKDLGLTIERLEIGVASLTVTNESSRIGFTYDKLSGSLGTRFEVKEGESWLEVNVTLPDGGYSDLASITEAEMLKVTTLINGPGSS